jgi:GNAT superfamily N-acetyltransferase
VVPVSALPALKIARLATHQEYEGRGIGRAMLLKTVAIAMRISCCVGCRMITVDAKPDAVGFYLKYGFQKALTKKKKDTAPLYRDFYRSYQEAEKSMSPLLSTFDEGL